MGRVAFLGLLAAAAVVAGDTPWDACTLPSTTDLPFCNTKLPIDQRVADLVQRIELEESGQQLTARESPSIDRLGLPSYYWGTNAIHGIQNTQCVGELCPTAFPAPCALASTWNMTNVQKMGEIIGTELRGYFNSKNHNSLDTWSPTINLNRDPRWGRNVESPGEDPLLCGKYGSAYTEGLQAVSEGVRMATVTLKHWVAYSVENYNGTTRHNFDANVSAYDLASSYLPAWEETVGKAGAKGVMCSYNMLNGKPTCGNANLTAVLTKDYGFTGYITSDTDSCRDIYDTHHYQPDGDHAAAECLASGTDIDSGKTYIDFLQSAVQKGLVTKEVVQQRLHNSLKMRFEMGLFDPNVTNRFKEIPKEVIGQPSHRAASLTAARQAMTLLKNEGGLLPFAKGKKVAVIGTSANSSTDILGNYNGPLCPGGHFDCVPTIFQKVREVGGGETTVVELDWKDAKNVAKAVAAAEEADFVVLIASNAKDGGGESHDRYTISLESSQMALAQAVLAKAPSKTALVLINGGIIAIDGLKDTAPAILEAFMPGMTGAQAIAETIFGDNNPGGKLPVTVYPSTYINEVDFLNMSMTAGPGRSYRYYKGTPLFPFGFGLSYTTFTMKWKDSTAAAVRLTSLGSTGTITAEVTNTGVRDGDEVVQMYIKPIGAIPTLVDAPKELKRLADFQRVHVKAGQTIDVTFQLPASAFTMVDSNGHRALHPGAFEVVVTRGHGGDLILPVAVDVPHPVLVRHFRKWW
eukprot:Sspe_Gene.93162::Locus_65868_Transcript_2_2_Confidence_0.667_Length_2346::g.93162::m.93162